MTFICVFCLEQGFPVTWPLPGSSRMEQEDTHGVCEGPDSDGTGMGSDFENSEDREGDPDEREMGSNAQDADKKWAPTHRTGEETGSSPREERELVSDICTGEEKAGMSVEVGAHVYFWLLPSCSQGQPPCQGAHQRDH